MISICPGKRLLSKTTSMLALKAMLIMVSKKPQKFHILDLNICSVHLDSKWSSVTLRKQFKDTSCSKEMIIHNLNILLLQLQGQKLVLQSVANAWFSKK